MGNRAFEATYGVSELDLLAMTDKLLAKDSHD